VKKETPAQTIRRLQAEKAQLLDVLNRYMPSAVMIPQTDYYNRWRADCEKVSKLAPGWR
jgi:hypothetical protein